MDARMIKTHRGGERERKVKNPTKRLKQQRYIAKHNRRKKIKSTASLFIVSRNTSCQSLSQYRKGKKVQLLVHQLPCLFSPASPPLLCWALVASELCAGRMIASIRASGSRLRV